MFINKVIDSMKEGTFFYKTKCKMAELVIKNSNTRNKFLQDMALKELRRDYSSKLDEIINSYSMEPAEYSDKVWVFWRQGYDAAPQLIKACFDSVKRNLTDREIIFLSDENIDKYIELPDYIVEKKKQGIIPEAQYSDIVRISLLAKYGGLWLDSTVLCTGAGLAKKMERLPLFVFKLVDLDRTDETALICSNWLISCYKNVPYIRAVRDMIYEYWKKEKYMKNYFIFHLFMHMVKDKYAEEWKKIPTYNNISPHILSFEMLEKYDKERFDDIKKMSDFHKLNRHVADEVSENISDTYFDMIIKEKIW